MVKVRRWLKQAYENIVDPDRDERVEQLQTRIKAFLKQQGRKFQLHEALAGIEYREKDLEYVTNAILTDALERGWKDGTLTDSEQNVIGWIIQALQIPNHIAQQKKLDFAYRAFANCLAGAIEDGVIDSNEETQLNAIAHSVGLSFREFARVYFANESASFLRSVFLACVADGVISAEDWNYLLHCTSQLGVEENEMLAAIQPQARQFVEHLLADAKSDERLSEDEDAVLQWMLGNLGLPPEYVAYVSQELDWLRCMTQIDDGRLPSLTGNFGVETRAGEIVHHQAHATWRIVKQLKKGPKVDHHIGVLTITDNRLIFSSQTRSQTINLKRIISHRGTSRGIEIQVESKPVSTFILKEDRLAYPVLRTAIALVLQTKLVSSPSYSRHIPRDVRQRVWTRYGGRCAECNADDYLEFDHVIPVAKGGSNADANVQLLCRRCNQKKSDNI